MPDSFVLPVVMAGGSGARLWPLNRTLYPKQSLALNGTQTSFQQAVVRISALGDDKITVLNPCVVANEEHRFLALDQLREIAIARAALVLEPCARNTAPALMLAAQHAIDREPAAGDREPKYLYPLGGNSSAGQPRIDLEVIEVQSGSYLGEDDIVRFQDSYGRN